MGVFRKRLLTRTVKSGIRQDGTRMEICQWCNELLATTPTKAEVTAQRRRWAKVRAARK